MTKANYGYKDGSGEYFITIDTDLCNSCGKCVDACPEGVLEMGENELDPLGDEIIAIVSEAHRKKIKYSCAPCKHGSETRELPCVKVCVPKAIVHSW
ncbi:MAG: 4Fe-4S binding protein [Promethearchaeota archaeon]